MAEGSRTPGNKRQERKNEKKKKKQPMPRDNFSKTLAGNKKVRYLIAVRMERETGGEQPFLANDRQAVIHDIHDMNPHLPGRIQ